MDWWRKMMLPLHRLCSGVASRFRFRKNGVLALHREVKACEYKDVHIMWEMLKKSERGLTQYQPAKTKNISLCNIFGWAHLFK